MILVTGASGTVGSEVVTALQKKGAKFAGAYRDLAKAPQGVQAVRFDYDDPTSFGPALIGVDLLFLLTPPAQSRELEQGLALVEAAKKAGVKKIVKLSALGVEANPDSPHRKTELAIEASGLKWTHLRPTFFHQNFAEGHAASIKGQKAFALPAGKGLTGFIDARDVAAAAAVVMTTEGHDGKAYGLTGPELLDHDQVAEALSAAVGAKVSYHDVADAEFRAALKGWGVSDYMIELYSALYGYVKAGYTSVQSPDLNALTGFKGIRFADFAKEAAPVWK